MTDSSVLLVIFCFHMALLLARVHHWLTLMEWDGEQWSGPEGAVT